MNIKVYTQLYCREALEKLDSYLDRELSSVEIQDIKKHLLICKHCAVKYKHEADLMWALKSKVRRIDAPPQLLNKIMTAITNSSPAYDEE